MTGFTPAAASASVVLAGCSDGTVVPGLAAGRHRHRRQHRSRGRCRRRVRPHGQRRADRRHADGRPADQRAAQRHGDPGHRGLDRRRDNAGGAGIASYTLQRSTDGGTTWSTLASGLTTTSRTTTVPSSGTTRFRVRAIDKAGERRVLGGGVAVGPARPAQLGGVHYSVAVDARVVYELLRRVRPLRLDLRPLGELHVHRQIIAVVVRRARRAARSGSTSMASSRRRSTRIARPTQYRSVIWHQAFRPRSRSGSGSSSLATSGRPRVDLDAFAVIK